MISKEECQKHFSELLRDAIPKGQEALAGVVITYLQFLVKNYDNLDQEMQTITDKMLDETVELSSEALASAADSPAVRQAKRILKSLKEKRPTAKGLILGLEQSSQINEPFIAATREIFEKHLQHLVDILFDVIEGGMHGPAPFVKVSMFYSCINEMICAFFLAQRGYVSQAYTHIRTVFESLNLVELINRDDHYAEIWSSDDVKLKMRELSPGAVRKKLGQDKTAYSFFSEYGAHPTMGYVHTYTAKRQRSDNERPEITFWLGGTKWTPHLLWANSACIFALEMTLVYVGLSFESRLHHEDYPALLETCLNEFTEYYNVNLLKWEQDRGLDTSEIEEISKMVFDQFKKIRK